MEEKKMFREVKISKVNPIYAIGIAFFLYGLIFPLYRITDLIIAIVVSVVCFMLAERFIPKETILQPLTETGTLDSRCMEIIEAGYAYIAEIEAAHKETALSGQVKEIIDISRQMLDYTVRNPRVALELRTFIDYYFPTTIKLLQTYNEMREQDVKSGNVTAIMEKVHSVMDTIVTAYRKQLDSMFAHKKLDIKTDIEVLKTVLATEGLTDKEGGLSG